MKLLNVEVHNILKVSDANLDVSGYHIYLVGGTNGSGKTSVLKAIACALCGRRNMGDEWPDVLLKEGQDEGWVRLELSGDDELHEPVGLTVELFLRRKRGGVIAEEFRVMDSTGEEAPEPRATLKRLYSFRAFDPLAFEKAKPKDRAALLRDLVGLDFTELDEEYDSIYKSRTVINTQGKSKKAQMEGIEVPDGTPDDPLSVSDLFDELQEGQRHNRACESARRNLQNFRAKEEKLQDEEQKLIARLAEIDKERQALDQTIDDQEKLVESMKEIDLNSIQDKIASADEINRAVEAKHRKTELFQEVTSLRKTSKEMTDKLETIAREKQSRLENAKWPLSGMSLDDSGVLLDGLPFEQASKAQRVLASVKVGMALNPKLRLLVCQDGNDLDNETMSALDKVIAENDFQLLLEYVTRSDEDESRCAVVMRDGTPIEPPAEELVTNE